MPSQVPESAATNSASPLLSAIVDCFLLDAVIGYQQSLPHNHDAVLPTLSRSASPAQSESPHVNTELHKNSFRSFQIEYTVMIPGFPRRYRRIDLMCPCRSNVHGLMKLPPSRNANQLGQSITVFQQVVGRLFVRLQASPSHLSQGVSQRSVGELLSAGMFNSPTYEESTPKLYLFFVFYQGFVPGSALLLSSPRCF